METSPCLDSEQTSVLIVDDHGVLADAIGLAINRESDMHCVATAVTGAQARAMAAHWKPDVVLMDVRLGDDDGIEVAADLARAAPDVRIIVLSAFIDQTLLTRAVNAGACALLPKDGSLDEILAAVRSSTRTGFAVNPVLMRNLVRSGEPRRGPPVPRLTPREEDVLRRLSDGADAVMIARDLGISLSTCRGYVKSLLRKLHAHSQLEAVVTASRIGLVSPTPRD
ncbi:transcriptional regulator [Intrasporangium oryzae NRRL B-24470]|uniref:Transcriptional regulator n=1 Tax=Intrasporangium oryzae NRRL B-24470 TaxID=1386089 RepID=W9G528_9MICO|nr:response regulator transcription factor [Intrasporangium oryzae]EWT00417.1 transcriptional regulator [Intrasporangium oryzae NRRL B-24470]